MSLPEVVSPTEWQAARDALLVKEKAQTRALDALNAERRRLPMTAVHKAYVLHGPDGPASLLGLFEGRRQLVVYHFMLDPGSGHRCPGCSFLTDHMPPLAHLHARDTTLAITAPAPLEEITPFKERMGWTVPWYSTDGGDFTADCVGGGGFGLSVFLRDGENVYRTYFTNGRGTDLLNGTLRYLDLTPLGRQEEWEEPAGRGDSPSGAWWRLHDEYTR
jgi:predicted dithiol-disulfide oxidoreductase (DUF899 family)